MAKEKLTRCNNRDARAYVQSRKTFKANNLFGHTYKTFSDGEVYVVYSYGQHFPLFVYHYRTGTWFENEDRYSKTTSKHRSQAHPWQDTKKAKTEFLCTLVSFGLVEAIAHHAGLPQATAA